MPNRYVHSNLCKGPSGRGQDIYQRAAAGGDWSAATTAIVHESAASVDSIGVEGHILDVESNTSHVLVSHGTLLGGPLEGGLD